MGIDIASAVRNRQIVTFNYGGRPRKVIPAAYGRHATTGSAVLRGYQVGGSSNSGSVPSWRLFEERKMRYVLITDEIFSRDPPGYKRGDRDLNPIVAQL